MTSVINHRTVSALDLIVSDVIGPIKYATFSGNVYVNVLVLAHTSLPIVHMQKHKSETTDNNISSFNRLETQLGARVKRYHSDGGRETVNNKMQEYCDSKGIVQTHTVAHTPQHNSIAERMNQSLINAT